MLTTQPHDRRVRRQASPRVESLDDRVLLSGGARAAPAAALAHDRTTDHASRDHTISPRAVLTDRSRAALPANLSEALRSLYREYKHEAGDSRSTPSLPGDELLSIRGLRVAVRIKVAFPPALGAYLRDLRADGLQIIRTIPAEGEVVGMLPVAKLPAVARLAAHVWPATLPDQTVSPSEVRT